MCARPSTPRACQETKLQQIRLNHIFQRARIFAHRRGHSFQPDRPARIRRGDGAEVTAVQFVQSQFIHAFEGECIGHDLGGEFTLGFDVCKVAYTPQQAVGDAWRAACPLGDRAERDLKSAPGSAALHVQHAPARSVHNQQQILNRVELQVICVMPSSANAVGHSRVPPVSSLRSA